MNPEDVTLTDCLRFFVREQALLKSTTDLASKAFLAVQVQGGKAWRNATSRLVRNYCAVVVDPDRSHTSKVTYVWRYVTEHQLYERFELVLDALLSNPLDRLTLNFHLHAAVTRVKREIHPLAVDFNHLMDKVIRIGGRPVEISFRVCTRVGYSKFTLP